MFGAEPHGTYNRILLSSVLGGFQDPEPALAQSAGMVRAARRLRPCRRQGRADRPRQARVVVGGGGKVEEPYDYLVLATGSRPFVPPMEGTASKGVFVFRTLDDCARHRGLCPGLRAGRGHRRRPARAGSGAGPAQPRAGSHRRRGRAAPDDSATRPGRRASCSSASWKRWACTSCSTQATTASARRDGAVTGVRFKDGSTLDTDMVVISCGIRPNVEVAKAAGLAVERAIVVDDQLRTSDPAIFAVGECAQHRGKLYGLVDPVYEQARVLADVLTGAKPRRGLHRLAAGDHAQGHGRRSDCRWARSTRAVPIARSSAISIRPRASTRKLVLRDSQLVGAVLLGASDPTGRLLRLFKERPSRCPNRPLDLLAGENARDALLESAAAADLIGLRRRHPNLQLQRGHQGQHRRRRSATGKCTIAAIGECTRAGTGCGTCQPLLGQLIDACTRRHNGGKASRSTRSKSIKQAKGRPRLPAGHPCAWRRTTTGRR